MVTTTRQRLSLVFFFWLSSKDGYGNSVLLSFSIIPIENDKHLVWTVECSIRHGLRVDIYPILSDQGNLLHAANSLQRTTNHGSHPYRKLLYLMIYICVQHYFFSINKQLKPLKAAKIRNSEYVIQLEAYCQRPLGQRLPISVWFIQVDPGECTLSLTCKILW